MATVFVENEFTKSHQVLAIGRCHFFSTECSGKVRTSKLQCAEEMLASSSGRLKRWLRYRPGGRAEATEAHIHYILENPNRPGAEP